MHYVNLRTGCIASSFALGWSGHDMQPAQASPASAPPGVPAQLLATGEYGAEDEVRDRRAECRADQQQHSAPLRPFSAERRVLDEDVDDVCRRVRDVRQDRE